MTLIGGIKNGTKLVPQMTETRKGLEGKPSKPLISMVELEGIEPTAS